MICKYFLPFRGLSFHFFLVVCFDACMFLILFESILSIFSLVVGAVDAICKYLQSTSEHVKCTQVPAVSY